MLNAGAGTTEGEGQGDLPGTRTARGRKDGQGTPKKIVVKRAADALAELMQKKAKMEKARDAYNDAVKEAAEASGLLSSVVKKLVKAHASPKKYAEMKDEADQQAMVFSDIPAPKIEKPEGETEH